MKRFLCLVLVLTPLLFSCTKSESKPLVLWTDCVEFVSYTELFNAEQDEVKIVALYKDAVETALPPTTEQKPDIIAGTFLQSEKAKKQFAHLDSLFKTIPQEEFYPSLLAAGVFEKKQHLIPVSFNLPAMVFHAQNYDHIPSGVLSFDQIKELSKNFNVQNEDGEYKAMGFGSYWNANFLYLVFKTEGITYSTENKKLAYSEYPFNHTLENIRYWSSQINGGPQSELDFAFKYLYTPFYEQVQNGHCLFSYATSNQIMALSDDQLENIDFRWICNNDKIQIEDDVVMMGIYSSSKNKAAAKKFLLWFFNEDNQKKMLDRKFAMKLRTQTFGIAGGFSSIQSVNQKHFPLYYRSLLSNLPESQNLASPQIFPNDWQAIKTRIVIPYISATTVNSNEETKSLSERYAEYIFEKESF